MKKENLKMKDFCEKKEKNLLPLIMEGKKSAAFTLAETLITLTILGVVAAITVPMLINKQMEAANRTKLKKVMAAYEKAINQMIVDNNISGSVKSWAEEVENCGNTNLYFKFINGGNCRFQTADKVWWDITDIEHPIISLKDKITTDAEANTIKGNADSLDKDKTSFVMVGEIKDGIVRINDKGATNQTPDKDYLGKLYAFINKDGSTSTPSVGSAGLYANGCDPADNITSCDYGHCSIKDCQENEISNSNFCTAVSSDLDMTKCLLTEFINIYDANNNRTAIGTKCSHPTDITSCEECYEANNWDKVDCSTLSNF